VALLPVGEDARTDPHRFFFFSHRSVGFPREQYQDATAEDEEFEDEEEDADAEAEDA